MMYKFIDSGEGKRLEDFGGIKLVRPCAHAIWPKKLSEKNWEKAEAHFSRKGEEKWSFLKKVPQKWEVEISGIKLIASLTDFGHVGIFPEHAFFIEKLPRFSLKGKKILHLFAHTGLLTLALAKKGASICHVDASKPAVEWAKENAKINKLQEAPIRWIVEDVGRFVKRELNRKVTYDAIILDPPSFGRGPKKEVFKIEKDLMPLLENLKGLLSKRPSFLLLTCHSPHFTPKVLERTLCSIFSLKERKIEAAEILLDNSLPLGSSISWY